MEPNESYRDSHGALCRARLAVAGVIAAIAVADRTGPGHPYVWQRIFVVLATTLLSALAVMLAAYVQGRTE